MSDVTCVVISRVGTDRYKQAWMQTDKQKLIKGKRQEDGCTEKTDSHKAHIDSQSTYTVTARWTERKEREFKVFGTAF